MNKKVVITYGTFDLFHHGHINIIKNAKSMGDFLIVGLSTDTFNNLKSKVAYDDYETRKKNLMDTGLVDLVIPETSWEQKIDDINSYNVNLLVMGSDWKGFFDEMLEGLCETKYFERTEGISSSMLRNKIKLQ